jgi:hypothetical protein
VAEDVRVVILGLCLMAVRAAFTVTLSAAQTGGDARVSFRSAGLRPAGRQLGLTTGDAGQPSKSWSNE